MVISGIITKGHATQPYWIKSYQIQTRGMNQGFKWINYQEPYGHVKVRNPAVLYYRISAFVANQHRFNDSIEYFFFYGTYIAVCVLLPISGRMVIILRAECIPTHSC